jgi:hypothetical protein
LIKILLLKYKILSNIFSVGHLHRRKADAKNSSVFQSLKSFSPITSEVEPHEIIVFRTKLVQYQQFFRLKSNICKLEVFLGTVLFRLLKNTRVTSS